MNVRSKILKIRNLPTDGELIDHINAKPYLFILVCIAIGLALMFTRLYLIGIVITFMFLYYLLFVKDVTLIEFYDKYAIFYLNNGKDECFGKMLKNGVLAAVAMIWMYSISYCVIRKALL